jgi:peroxiredoxin
MLRLICAGLSLALVAAIARAEEPKATKKVEVGAPAPEFKIKDAAGKTIDLAELTAKGPVLLRLTCGCSGCDKELAYFQAIHEAYKDAGLTSVAVFRENDEKMVKYAREKKITLLYAVDPKGESWNVFQTKAMPVNFLIDKGGKILHIASGCDPSGLLAKKVSEKAARTVNAPAVDVKARVEEARKQK